MRRYAVAWLALPFLSAVGAAQNYEANPFFGYGTNGRIPAENAVFRDVEATEGSAYGLRTGYNFNEESAVEFAWSRQNMELRGVPRAGSSGHQALLGVHTDQLHLNFLYHFGWPEKKLRPFAFTGVGATVYSARASGFENEYRPSFAVGAGFKYFFTKHAGVRMQARWAPTWLTGQGQGFLCRLGIESPNCLMTVRGHFQTQADFTLGPVFRF